MHRQAVVVADLSSVISLVLHDRLGSRGLDKVPSNISVLKQDLIVPRQL